MLPQKNREKGTEIHVSLSGLQKVTQSPPPQYRIQLSLLLENENPTRAKKSKAPTAAGQSRERETQRLPPRTAPPLPSPEPVLTLDPAHRRSMFPARDPSDPSGARKTRCTETFYLGSQIPAHCS